MHQTECPLCAKKEIRPLRGFEAAHLARCMLCSFVFSSCIPPGEELRAYYANYPRISHLPSVTIARYDKLLDRFEKFRQKNRIMDLGCGNGLFLERAKMRGWQVWGTELSNEAIESCISKGITVVQPGSLSNLNPGSFDVITSFEVIEHLSHPARDAEFAYVLLRRGGLIYLTTPNFDSLTRRFIGAAWNVIGYPEHLSYFTRRTLNRLLTVKRFRKLNAQTTGINPARILQSLSPKKHSTTPGNTGNEQFREQVENRPYLRLLKRSINFFLNLTGTGESLKALYQKVD